MKRILLLLSVVITLAAKAQLTVEKIMQDSKWMGTSPSGVTWSYDSKWLYFNWNPDQNTADSLYAYSLSNRETKKLKYNEGQYALAIANGTHNTARTKLVFVYRGDIYLLDILTGKILQITRTEDQESNARFAMKDEWIVYNKNQNLYGWNIATGINQQLTDFKSGTDNAAPAAPAGGRGMGMGAGGRNNSAAIAAAGSTQEQWLAQNQLLTSDIIKERKHKKEQHEAYLKGVKETDTLRVINIGEKNVQGVQISPDGRFISYRLTQNATGTKSTVVPEYVSESGFTNDLPGRTKVGVAQGKSELYVYDRMKDTVILVKTDSLPGITDQPDYYKDYPAKFADKKKLARPVNYGNLVWNESGSAAFMDIRSQDNKDRWIVLVNGETGKLTVADHQRDEAWIGGPGVGFGAKEGWVNEGSFYYQSEVTGYSHLYIYHLNDGSITPLTKGKYEVQDVVLSKNKQYFYILTNEEHPGKQSYYRIKTDGSGKEKLTGLTGGYECSLSPDEKYIAYRYSYITKPWELYYQESAAGKKPVQVTSKAASAAFLQYPWRDTKIFTITARDGQPVYARLYEPKAGMKNNAAVIFVHGAGYLQNVHYWFAQYFREQMFNNLLADKGYTVLDIDYRGSSGYGRDWRTGIYRFMGGKDLDDEVDAARYLVKEQGIDSTRIGMYGGSYGGFMTLMALFTQPDVFKAGAALRPVTDWAHYNHGYTAAILNEPFNDSLAYRRSSPIYYASGLKNHLLICHGMEDLNVHFQDAVRLSQRLIELGKDNWELAAYPLEDHGFVEPSSWTDEYKRILKLFDHTLLK